MFIYEACSKSIKTEAIFTKIEMNNEWNVNFLQNTYVGMQYTYSSGFLICRSISEIPLLEWCEGAVSYFFECPKSRTKLNRVSIESVAIAQLCNLVKVAD